MGGNPAKPELRREPLERGKYRTDGTGGTCSESLFGIRLAAALGTLGCQSREPVRAALERCSQFLAVPGCFRSAETGYRSETEGVSPDASRVALHRQSLCEASQRAKHGRHFFRSAKSSGSNSGAH